MSTEDNADKAANESNSLLKWVGVILFVIMMMILINNGNSTGSNKFGSVEQVCDYLNEQGIPTRKSRNPDVTGAICLSDYVDLDGPNKNKLPNNIAYYVEGKGSNIDRLKVVINFNQPPSTYAEKSARTAFETLLNKSLGVELFPELEEAIKQRKTEKWNLTTQQGKLLANVNFVYEKWPNPGYEFKLIIE